MHGWDRQSALFGASPGALAQVMVLSAEYKADLRAIAIVQTLRVVALTVGIPVGARAVRADGGGRHHGAARRSHPDSLAELAILVAVSTASALAVWRLRLPGGLMFGAMLGVRRSCTAAAISSAALPWWVAMRRGDRHRRDHRLALRQHLSADAAALPRRGGWLVHGVRLRSRPLLVLLLTMLLSVPVADAVVAFAPGAQDTMMVLALALHLDPVFVGALHLSRFCWCRCWCRSWRIALRRRLPTEAADASGPPGTRPVPPLD